LKKILILILVYFILFLPILGSSSIKRFISYLNFLIIKTDSSSILFLFNLRKLIFIFFVFKRFVALLSDLGINFLKTMIGLGFPYEL
jgi:hypothetical protein